MLRTAASAILATSLVLSVGAPDAAAVTAGSITVVDAHVPTGASAALVNITMVDGAAPGYITADLCSVIAPGPQARSNGNHSSPAAVANLSVVPVNANGQFCIFNQSKVEIVVDVQGYFAPAISATDGRAYVAASPSRLLDTRIAPAVRPLAGSITKVATGLPSGTSSALVNLTMVDGEAPGYITADACSVMTAGPQSKSSGNHRARVTIANVAVVPLDADGSFCIFNQVGVDLVVDLQGSFRSTSAAGTGGLFYAGAAPNRVLDTRDAPISPLPSGTVTTVHTGAPVNSAAVLANITMVDAVAAGYVTADACSALRAGPQAFSNGNVDRGTTIANLAVVPIDADGTFCIYNQMPIDLVVDIQGTFSTAGSEQFVPVAPTRVLDTRPPPSAGTACTSVVHIGDSTSVGLISPSILPDPADRVDAEYRRVGVVEPRMEISGVCSIVETLPGQVNARDTAAAIKAAGYEGCWVFALGTTDTANVAVGGGVSRRERIDRMMAVVGDDPVLWVDVRTLETTGVWSNQNMQLWNQQLLEAGQRYPNLRIYDWATVAETAWFSSDKIHYTPEGYRQRAHLIADALAAAYPG